LRCRRDARVADFDFQITVKKQAVFETIDSQKPHTASARSYKKYSILAVQFYAHLNPLPSH
jgi:hypothetical protein